MFNPCKIRTSERSPHLNVCHSVFLYSPSSSSSPPAHPLTSFSYPPPPPPPPPPCPALPPWVVSNSSASRERRRGLAILTTSPWRPRRERLTTIARHTNPTCVHVAAQHGACDRSVCLFASGCRGEGGGSERACFKDQPWLALTCHW